MKKACVAARAVSSCAHAIFLIALSLAVLALPATRVVTWYYSSPVMVGMRYIDPKELPDMWMSTDGGTVISSTDDTHPRELVRARAEELNSRK